MRRGLKIFGRLLLALLVVALSAICGALAWRLYRQNQFTTLLSLSGPHAIREAHYVTVGGIKQWIGIRGENKANPVILFVHGGPGAALSGEAATC